MITVHSVRMECYLATWPPDSSRICGSMKSAGRRPEIPIAGSDSAAVMNHPIFAGASSAWRSLRGLVAFRAVLMIENDHPYRRCMAWREYFLE